MNAISSAEVQNNPLDLLHILLYAVQEQTVEMCKITSGFVYILVDEVFHGSGLLSVSSFCLHKLHYLQSALYDLINVWVTCHLDAVFLAGKDCFWQPYMMCLWPSWAVHNVVVLLYASYKFYGNEEKIVYDYHDGK